MAPVVVTGIGVLLPRCDSRDLLWRQLLAGVPMLTREDAPGDGTRSWWVGRVRELDPERRLMRFPHAQWRRCHREQLIYLSAVAGALADAGLEIGADAERVGIYDGTSRGPFDWWFERIRAGAAYGRDELIVGTPGQAASLAGAMLGVRGPVVTMGGTCCAGLVAIGHAARAVAAGDVDVAIASGHDSALSAPVHDMYRSLELLGDGPVRPFVDHSRNAFGEGAVVLVLEAEERAAARGARVLARLGGFHLANHGHPTGVDPSGEVAARAIAAALGDRPADEIDVVVGHGNGVEASDHSEIATMRRVLGERAARVPLLSTKPVYGHTLAASTALNVAAGVLMIAHGQVFATGNVDHDRADPGVCHRPPPDAGAPGAAIALGYGIGGHVAAMLVTR